MPHAKGHLPQVLPLWPALVEATRFIDRAWDESPVVDPARVDDAVGFPEAA